MKKRDVSADLIRCIGFCFLISNHFLGNTNLYTIGFFEIEKKALIVSIIRSYSLVCVPIFILLTGYLMCNKVINEKNIKKYYINGIIKILGFYSLASLFTAFYKNLYFHENIGFWDFVRATLRFTLIPYAWYVEMYIGLFLLIPFLNILYKSIETKTLKKILILSMLTLTALTSVTNIFQFNSYWILHPISSEDYTEIIPNYWLSIYPVTYYFIGCYIKEFKFKIRKKIIFLIWIITVLLFAIFMYYRSYGSSYLVYGEWQSWGSLPVTIITVLVFLFFIDSERYIPKFMVTKLYKLSDLCFGAYLLSYVCDTFYYTMLNLHVDYVSMRLKYYIFLVPIIIISSFILSYIVNKIFLLIQYPFKNKIHKKLS